MPGGRTHGKAAFEIGENVVDPLVAALQRTRARRGRAS